MNRTTLTALTLATAGILGHPALAADPEPDDRWALCPVEADPRAAEIPTLTDLAPDATQVTADEAFAEAESITRLQGNVVVQRGSAALLGNSAEYDKRSGELFMHGNVSYRNQGARIDGDEAQLNMSNESGRFNGTRFFFPASHSYGHAGTIAISDAKHATLEDLSYTTCPPERVDWQLKARELTLDQATNTGEAWGATLSFKGVPFFYSPYLNFPLEGRKSGLLPPTFGSSDINGSDITLPVYWNIAPNQDATFTPRSIDKRGAMMMGEYRFMTENSNGQINGSYLDNDKIYGDNRSYLSLQHNANYGSGWSSNLFYQRASDSDYFLDDLGSNGESTSLTHLEQRADLNYSDRYWQFLARVEDFQTLSGTAPYQRMPQLSLNGATPERNNRLRFTLASETVRFSHDSLVPTGDRIDLKPAASLPLSGAAWFFTPKVAWRYTQYQLNDYSQGEEFSRSLPITSVDSGLFFERSLQFGDTPYLQTLEPRLFYLNVPYEDQSDLPLFDTGQSDLSFSQMFSDNRFNGADRQGDADRLTVALTSRFLDDRNGKERFRASIGQVHYYRDRKVTLNSGDPISTRKSSDLIGELAFSPSDALNMSATEQWNPDTDEVEQLNGRLRYTPARRKVLNLSYRYHRANALHQTDVAMFWPLARQWRLLARYQYDLDNEVTLDTIGGLEYESCCWSVRVLARARRNAVDDSLNHSIYLTLQLKGLANLGRGLEDSVERGILGNY